MDPPEEKGYDDNSAMPADVHIDGFAGLYLDVLPHRVQLKRTWRAHDVFPAPRAGAAYRADADRRQTSMRFQVVKGHPGTGYRGKGAVQDHRGDGTFFYNTRPQWKMANKEPTGIQPVGLLRSRTG